jgi:hypothetical protein
MMWGGCGIGSEAFNQFDDFRALPGCKFKERFKQPQTFHSFAGWSSEIFVQLGSKRRIFHLAPLTGNGVGISRQT